MALARLRSWTRRSRPWPARASWSGWTTTCWMPTGAAMTRTATACGSTPGTPPATGLRRLRSLPGVTPGCRPLWAWASRTSRARCAAAGPGTARAAAAARASRTRACRRGAARRRRGPPARGTCGTATPSTARAARCCARARGCSSRSAAWNTARTCRTWLAPRPTCPLRISCARRTSTRGTTPTGSSRLIAIATNASWITTGATCHAEV
mmetsp:Transcript_41945/g.119674  ORF Transcript_41945/g.119674 Transcript_41945/m.119674 type:complete len:210 (+) Transcript_41945:188-817(+)